MVEVRCASLEGKLPEIGGVLRIERVEWWKEAPHFVLLRYSVGGRVADHGVRMDLDKKAILDSVGDAELDIALRKKRVDIWRAAVEAKSAMDGGIVAPHPAEWYAAVH